MSKNICMLGCWLLLAGCDGRATDAPIAPVSRGVAGLPHLSQNGRSIPYFRYVDASPTSGNGQVFFLYPMMDERSGLLDLEFNPLSRHRIEELFAEDVEDAPGISGIVSNEDGVLRIGFLPISLPIGVEGGHEWPLRYVNRDFHCRSGAAEPTMQGKLSVSCSSPHYTLNFIFNRDRGVEEYQDFCGNSICTFRLIDEEGLLSREVLDHMGLPRI